MQSQRWSHCDKLDTFIYIFKNTLVIHHNSFINLFNVIQGYN